jgi:hypothetical protein
VTRRAVMLATVWAASVLLAVGSLALFAAAHGSSHASTPSSAIDWLLPFAFLSFTTVGALLAAKRPRNPIGWLFLVAGLLIVVNSFATAYSRFGDSASAGRLDGTVGAAWVSQWIWGPAVTLLGTFLLLLFPTGHLLTRRWRVVAWLAVVAILVDTPLRMFKPGPLQNLEQVDNPLGIGRTGALLWTLANQQVGSWLQLVATAAAVVCLVLRFRRAASVEREQLKWFLAAAGLLSTGFGLVGLTNGASNVGWLLWLVGVFALPVATAIAILRYRLYEIDRIISRTLAYAMLTVILAAAYVGLVLAGQALFSSFAGGSNLAIAVSTLVVAALFLPLRSRVQQFVDRRFYRRRYDAQRTLEGFGARLREQIDLGTLEHDLRGVVSETMQPAHASVWLRAGARS